MTRFLLDANLSPKVARYLSRTLKLDVKSLHVVGLATLSDHDVVRLARVERRVIITLDRDFAGLYQLMARPDIGVIYLDLPGPLRFVSAINQILHTFFTGHAESVDLERSLVVLTGETVSILDSSDD